MTKSLRAAAFGMMSISIGELAACGGERTTRSEQNGTGGTFAGNAATGGSDGARGGDAPGGAGSSGAAGSAAGSASGGASPGGSAGQSQGGTGGIDDPGGAGSDAGMGGEGDGDATRNWTFDMDKEGWDIGDTEPEDLRNSVTLVWSGDDGEPMPGMLQAIVPFNDAGQVARVAVVPMEPADLTDKQLTANIHLSFGLDPDLASNPGTFRLYLRSGSAGVTAHGVAREVDGTGSWLKLSLNASSPESVESGSVTYDAADIREIGVEFGPNSSAESPGVAVVFVDTVAY